MHVLSFDLLANIFKNIFLEESQQSNCVSKRPVMCFLLVCFTKGAIDLAAKSAGIIPGSPVPVLDADGLPGVSPLSPDRVTTVVTGQESTAAHQNGGSITTVEVSPLSMPCEGAKCLAFPLCGKLY